MSKSGVWIDSHQLEAWCRAVIDFIEKYREKKITTYCQKIVDKKKNRRFFKKIVTVEQVRKNEDKLANLTTFHYFDSVYFMGDSAKYSANLLLKTCKVSPNKPVWVTTEDASLLTDWSPDGCVDAIFNKGIR